MSPFAYNESIAQDYFPLTEKEALRRGYNWRADDAAQKDVKSMEEASSFPLEISEVSDDVLSKNFSCAASGKPFRIVKPELEFYRKMQLPLPLYSPAERHARRMATRNPSQLWERECGSCSVAIKTSYSPEQPEKVYCEKCYLGSME